MASAEPIASKDFDVFFKDTCDFSRRTSEVSSIVQEYIAAISSSSSETAVSCQESFSREVRYWFNMDFLDNHTYKDRDISICKLIASTF